MSPDNENPNETQKHWIQSTAIASGYSINWADFGPCQRFKDHSQTARQRAKIKARNRKKRKNYATTKRKR